MIFKIILGFDPSNFSWQDKYSRLRYIAEFKNECKCIDWLFNAKSSLYVVNIYDLVWLVFVTYQPLQVI